jgi:hypothetical protein
VDYYKIHDIVYIDSDQLLEVEMTEQYMNNQDIKRLGRIVGTITGIVGYFSGALGAWALFVITETQKGKQPLKNSYVAHPSGKIVFFGASGGVLLTILALTFIVWRFEFYPKRFAAKPQYGSAILRGIGHGISIVVVAFGVMLYALGVAVFLVMWIFIGLFAILM